LKRVFSDDDRKKKSKRMSEKPPVTTRTLLPDLEETIKTFLFDGYLPCPNAFSIGKKMNLPLNLIGEKADTLGIRIIDCQLGCFKVNKSTHIFQDETVTQSILEQIERVIASGSLTCTRAFELACRMKVHPIEIAETANKLHIKIGECQLGCF
jgi:hypothetical protein